MTLLVVLFSYQIKLNISKSKTVTKILPKKLCYDLNWSSQWEKISFHGYFKINIIGKWHMTAKAMSYLL